MNQQVQTSIPLGYSSFESSKRSSWIDPELNEWTRRNAILAQQFSADLVGNDKSASVYFGLVVQITGDYIWATSRSNPEWAGLDVDGLQREILRKRLRLDDIATGNFNISLAAFYCFLFHRENLAEAAMIRILRRLEDYDNAYVSETFALANTKQNPLRMRSVHLSLLHRRTVAYAKTWTSDRFNKPRGPASVI